MDPERTKQLAAAALQFLQRANLTMQEIDAARNVQQFLQAMAQGALVIANAPPVADQSGVPSPKMLDAIRKAENDAAGLDLSGLVPGNRRSRSRAAKETVI